jgi:hypothetical protein
MGAIGSSEMSVNSYQLNIVTSLKTVFFIVTDMRMSSLTYCEVFKETAEAITTR